MASKAIYSLVAVVGIVGASGAAWWLQQPKSNAVSAESGQTSTLKSTLSASANPSGVANAPGMPGAPTAPGSAAGGGRPPSVEVAKVDVTKLTDETQAVGSLRSRRGVVVRPEVAGRITQLNFTDGQRVKAGQVLVQFDDQLQQAQIQQAQAELSIAQANQKRNQELVAQNFVSQRSLDETAANLQVAQAKLSLARATAARLKIVSPFDGVAGIRLVNVGDYLKDGADIVNIEDMDAIFVDYRLPERFQAKVKRGQTAQLDFDSLPGRKFAAQVQAVDPLIDANGRSVGVRACIDNRQAQLKPGMFARVNTVFGVKSEARVLPEEAIVPQGGKQFVIKLVKSADGKTQTTLRSEVKVGLRTPGKVEILEGVDGGDTVVTAGQQRLQKDGTVVSVVDLGSARSGGAGAPSPVGAASSPAGSASATAAPLSAAVTASAVPAATPVNGAPLLASPMVASASAAPSKANTPPGGASGKMTDAKGGKGGKNAKLDGPNPCLMSAAGPAGANKLAKPGMPGKPESVSNADAPDSSASSASAGGTGKVRPPAK